MSGLAVLHASCSKHVRLPLLASSHICCCIG
jgi:hypothetical protein